MDMRWFGIVLMGVFTLFWTSWAFGADVGALTVLGVVFMAAGVALILAAVALIRRGFAPRDRDSDSQPGLRAPSPGGRSFFRIFNIAVFVEFVAIIVAVQIVRHIDAGLIQPVIALIVGAHFAIFWFSPTTRHVLHLWMTAAGVAIGMAGIVAILRDASPALVHGWVGLAVSAITLTYGAMFVSLLRAEPQRPASGVAAAEPAESGT